MFVVETGEGRTCTFNISRGRPLPAHGAPASDLPAAQPRQSRRLAHSWDGVDKPVRHRYPPLELTLRRSAPARCQVADTSSKSWSSPPSLEY